MPKIGTHDGSFHCDEAFACYMLKSLPEFADYEIVRTRDPKLLKECDIVVDVGAVFEPKTLRFDHHQGEFTHTMRTLGMLDFDTKLSSAGLIYAHYGKRVIGALLNLDNHKDAETIDILYKKMYEAFVEAIDGVDNGVSAYDGEPRYHMGGSISSRVGYFNPAWNETEKIDMNQRFHSASQYVGAEFMDRLLFTYKSWLPAREIVKRAIEARMSVHPSGKILAFEDGGLPWKEHFFKLEVELGLTGDPIQFAIYPDQSKSWRVQAIPLNEKLPFSNRTSLMKEWRGVRDEDLAKIAGIDGCIFCHTTGFIGGNKTREGALKMALKTLNLD